MKVHTIVVEVKDQRRSYGLFVDLDAAIPQTAKMLKVQEKSIVLIPNVLNDNLFRVTVNGTPKSLWLEFRDVMDA